MRNAEHDLQVAFMTWVRLRALHVGGAFRYVFAIPNGGARSARTGARLKAEGVRRGVPDVCVAFPSGGYHGLWIEFKAPGGRLTPEQRGWLEALEDVGYAVAVCTTLADAQATLLLYIAGRHAMPQLARSRRAAD